MPLLLLLALQAPAAGRDIDAAVRVAIEKWHVPGCAVVVVRDDRVIYCEGHGFGSSREDKRVTADTLFPLSSCTKAFTTAALALLVEEGRIGWDDPVRKHLPWFRLSDPLVEDAVTLRDLLCHRTGIGPHELLWHRAPWGPEEAVRRLRHLPLSKPFRTTLQYQSTAFAAAGLAAADASKTSWSDLIRKRLLTPLGMKATCTSAPEMLKAEDYALPNRLVLLPPRAFGTGIWIPFDYLPTARFDPDYADPAISIYSNARDLGTWLRFHLAEGKPLLKRQLRETHTPQMVTRLSPAQKAAFPDTNEVSYAMGWAVHDYRGLKVVSHGGSIDGFRCHLAFVPEKRVGVAVLCNLERTPMPLALANALIDQQLGFPKRDWHALHANLDKALKARGDAPTPREGTKPSHEAVEFVGDYEHPAYGTVRVRATAKGLVWRWREVDALLEHYHHDTFALSNTLVHDALVTFSTNAAGHIDGFRVTGRLGVEFRKLKSKPR
jgi:CubicO group peptidase (beta-lactamase class C family)